MTSYDSNLIIFGIVQFDVEVNVIPHGLEKDMALQLKTT